jgi:hypothetical protein
LKEDGVFFREEFALILRRDFVIGFDVTIMIL